MKTEIQDTRWYIWSNEHRAWWGPDSCGYTPSIEHAGVYSFEEATSIVRDANFDISQPPNEAMVLKEAQ